MHRFRKHILIIVGLFTVAGAPGGATHAGATWSGLRGPGYDGAARDARLFADEGKAGLAIGWKRALGSGYSTVAAGDGLVVAMFAAGEADVVAGFDAATGDERWRYRIADAYKGHDGSHDGPIASPLLADGRVYGLGPKGDLFAVDAATGKGVWSRNIVTEHKAEAPYYGFATSPILVDGVLVVEIGAGAGKTIAGFKPADGSLLWSAGDDKIAYHSPIAAKIGGKLHVIASGQRTVYGLDAATGKVLWSYKHDGDESAMGGETIIPLAAGEGRFLIDNKGDSALMLGVTLNAKGAYETKELWSNNSISRSYVIPVYHDGHIYGMIGRILTCVDAATGETKWKSREPGDGFPTLVGKQLVIITKAGTLHVADASPAGYHETAKLDLFGEQSWSSVSYADGHIYARSMANLARIDPIVATAVAKPARSMVAGTAFGRFLEEAAKSADKNALIEKYLAQQKSFPIVEETGAVHFIYKGKANDVGIVGDMIGFRREDPMTRFADTDLYYYSTRLEPNAAVNYGFIVDYAKAAPDPRNPNPGKGLFGDVSWFTMPAWEKPAFLTDAEPSRQGRLETFEWESAVREGQKRTATVYLPAGYDPKGSRRYPVLYIHDGKKALEEGGMKNALDQLIGRSVQPLIAVFIIPGGENPDRELGDMEKQTTMVATELVPKIDERFLTIPRPDARGAAGAAGGAEAALFGVFKHPELFGRVGSQSATMMQASDFDALIRGAEEHPLAIYLEWGTYHLRSPHEAWDMARANRDLWTLLRANGQRPAGGEVPEGFGWNCWRGHIDDMLIALYPMQGI